MTSKESSVLPFTEESKKTQKIRKKVVDQIAEFNGKIDKPSLKRMQAEIAEWIARYGGHRVKLTNKSLALFDNNQNPQKCSSYVANLYKQLKKQYHE